MRQIRALTVVLIAMLLVMALPPVCRAQRNQPPFDTVVAETPWGQHVVPTIDTYIEIQLYAHLKRGQEWSEGGPLRAQLLEDYRSGRLKLRCYPWKITDGVYALGRDDMEQQIYLLDTGQGLLLIDPSYDALQQQVVAEIRQLGYHESQVKWVLLTHCHIDHSQSCHTWHEQGAKIYVGDADAHPVESGNTLLATWILREEWRHFIPSPVDQHVYDSDILHFGSITLHAISTPWPHARFNLLLPLP